MVGMFIANLFYDIFLQRLFIDQRRKTVESCTKIFCYLNHEKT